MNWDVDIIKCYILLQRKEIISLSSGEKDALKQLVKLQKYRTKDIQPCDKGSGDYIVIYQGIYHSLSQDP